MPPNLLAHYFYLGKPQWYGKPLKQRGFLPRQADIRRVTDASSAKSSITPRRCSVNFARPPVQGLDFEVDVRAVAHELVI